MKQFLMNLLMTRNMAANGYALLIYMLIAAKIVMLQYADATESCNPESVESCIHLSLIILFISVPVFTLFLLIKNTKWKTFLAILTWCPFMLPVEGLKDSVCCHESYADSPVEIYALLLLASLTILIIRCNYYMLLFVSYLILAITFKPLLKLIIYCLIRVGCIEI